MPARLRSRVDAVQAVTAASRTTTDPEVLVAVSEAVHLQEVFRFGYGDDETPHRVEPHAVVARNGRWYLLDRDVDRDDWRTHRIDRITPRMRTRVPFTPRPIPVAMRPRSCPRGSRGPRSTTCGRAPVR